MLFDCFDFCSLIVFQQESLLGTEWRNIKGQVLATGSGARQPSRKPFVDSPSLTDSKSTEASTSISLDELSAVDSATLPSTSRASEVRLHSCHQSLSLPSFHLVELLLFFLFLRPSALVLSITLIVF